MNIAWIGTGVMGRPMALHLAKAGHHVTVYNRTRAKTEGMAPHIMIGPDIPSCIKQADVIFSMVGYPEDVEAVYQVVMNHAKPSAILIDMTTSSPSLAVKLYHEAITKGFDMLDAPVTGGDLGAINATLSIMVGGDKNVFEKVLPLLEKLGSRINHMGGPGSGQHTKLANQTAIAGAVAGVAEALMYASAKQLDPYRVISVLTGGSAHSWQAEINGPKMIDKDYRPGFYVKHYLKDLKLAMAEKDDLALPVLEQVTRAYALLSKHGYSDMGTQSIIEYYLRKMFQTDM